MTRETMSLMMNIAANTMLSPVNLMKLAMLPLEGGLVGLARNIVKEFLIHILGCIQAGWTFYSLQNYLQSSHRSAQVFGDSFGK